MISERQPLQSDALDPECICSACVPQTTWENFLGTKNCFTELHLLYWLQIWKDQQTLL